jgi:beta-mannosidase
MNMLRVWGGGIYEDEAFYRACDRRGVMVWQDFMFACAMYPEEKWFLRNVKREAESAVRTLRNRPSLVLWCGNNENHWAAHAWWPQDPFGGETIYDEMLPKITARLDPSRPYWPGSPYGGKDPNSMSEGDRHAWDAWSSWRDYGAYLSDKGRFLSEFGFQGCPEMETVAHFGPLDELQPQHPLFERHNKMVEGTERLFRFLAGTFRVTTDLEEFVYLTQVLQAEAIKTGVLHWRSRMMKTAGALYWQINDCWPVISWASVDYRRRPKGLYWYTKRFFAPVAVRAAILPDGVSAWVINDTQVRLEGEFVIQSMTVDGQETAAVREHVEVAPNSAYRTGPFKAELLRIDDPSRQFVVATFTGADGVGVRDVALAARPKHMRVGDPGLDWVAAGDEGTFTLTVSARTLAYAVYLRLPGTEAVFSDNFFTLLPGESIDVTVRNSGLTAAVASKKLEAKWVKGGM